MGRRYEPALDGLRAIAVLLVMAFHAKLPGFGGGRAGVDVFFVLSGYLISSIFVGEMAAGRRLDTAGFYVRRALRLYPALLAMLAFYVIASPWLWPQRPFGLHLRDAALAGLYLTDYTIPFVTHSPIVVHTWSLAVEEQFYLLWPLLFPLLVRFGRSWALAGLYLAVTALRLHLGADDWRAGYMPLHTHCSGLILGALLALHRNIRAPVWAGPAGLAAIAFVCIGAVDRHLGITAAELGAAAVIAGAWREDSALGGLLAWRPLVLVGLISYGVYLWHYPIYTLTSGPPALRFGLTAAGSLAVAGLSYVTVEAWGRRVRQRFDLARRARAGAAPAMGLAS